MDNEKIPKFRPPSRFEHWFNAGAALLARFGISFPDGYQLLVRGRKSGKIYSVAVTVPDIDNKKYLVAPRGETQWVRNARAAGKITLKKGAEENVFLIGELSGQEKHMVLATYLSRYRKAVQRYFSLPAGSEPAAFEGISDAYPVFLLTPEESE
ncbi:MAG: nitroreductase [Pseudomonadota bacterium]